MCNEYKYRQRGVTVDIEYEDEGTRFCRKVRPKGSRSLSFLFFAMKKPGDLEPTVEHVQVG
jgi:hypothetical protein